MTKTFWLSFCDGEKPVGQQFLGACVVDVTEEEASEARFLVATMFPMAAGGAEWVAAASRKAHALGCNPGGEMASLEIDPDNPHIAGFPKGQLMDRAEITRRDDEIAQAVLDNNQGGA